MALLASKLIRSFASSTRETIIGALSEQAISLDVETGIPLYALAEAKFLSDTDVDRAINPQINGAAH